METQHLSFNFTLAYAGKNVICEVIMQDKAFDVLFDGKWKAFVASTEDWTWKQVSGEILPDEVIQNIGDRVESEYE